MLQNKTIVVTGGTGILGKEFVRAICKQGGKAVILGRNTEKGSSLAEEITSQGGSAFFYKADVLNRPELERAAQEVTDRLGDIHGLVNAAGGILPKGVLMPADALFSLDLEGVMQTAELNLWGTVFPTFIFGKYLARQQGKASIVNITSTNAKRAVTRVVGYNVGKAGVDCFNQWMAVELAHRYGDRIRMNSICPGFFLTEQNSTLLQKKNGDYTDRGQAIIRQTPFNRFGDPAELTHALVWLLSDASGFVTGTSITIDGGFAAFSGV